MLQEVKKYRLKDLSLTLWRHRSRLDGYRLVCVIPCKYLTVGLFGFFEHRVHLADPGVGGSSDPRSRGPNSLIFMQFSEKKFYKIIG